MSKMHLSIDRLILSTITLCLDLDVKLYLNDSFFPLLLNRLTSMCATKSGTLYLAADYGNQRP